MDVKNTDLDTQQVGVNRESPGSKEFGNLQENQSIHFKAITSLLENTQCSISTRKHKQDHLIQHCTQKAKIRNNYPSKGK